MIKLDKIDEQLLCYLQTDAKINIKELASKLNMTKTPIYERIRRLEREGVINKYVAVIDKEILDHAMVVFCSVSLDSQRLSEIKAFSKAVTKLSEVMECYLMGGSNDFLLKVVVKDLKAYHQFSAGKLAALPNVRLIKSTFVLNEVKHSTVYPLSF
ncbi:MAG: Lrp/AsnC family transcriptional regulator [Saprospiraceae bacterium]|nr:Lrp/AsnC family transcriptional regulator [Bacteroidia bacterium]NNE15158.1 Lrp/AsnC family transcriptional regulator [Saprospiraceae bacterium]NNL91504.1 Lrp/AsnC family transcriptional regulator [Saprospiraceae bacterium]